MIAAAFIFLLTAGTLAAAATNTFVVAAYNVENWVLMERDGVLDQPKPEAEKQAVVNVLAAVRPDVLGLAEMGTTNDLAELTGRLAARGLNYPHAEWIQGWDTTRHVALLSRFPITEWHSRNDYSYTIGTNVLYHSRGVIDVRVQVNDRYAFRAVLAHLKSRRQHDLYDHVVMRHAEARLLRQHLDQALAGDPALNLVVMGDFNDEPETKTVRTIIGQPPRQLVDLLPQDRSGRSNTYLWRFRRDWSRVDYLLVNTGLAAEYIAGSARIADMPGWGTASDHRAVYASFHAEEPSEQSLVLDGHDDPHHPPKPDGVTTAHRWRTIFVIVAAVILLDAVMVWWLLSRRPKPPG